MTERDSGGVGQDRELVLGIDSGKDFSLSGPRDLDSCETETSGGRVDQDFMAFPEPRDVLESIDSRHVI